MKTYGFPFQTGKITIDFAECDECENYACVKACSLFGRSILRIQDNRPVLVSEEANKRCIEDLSCELYCHDYGNGGLRIILDPLNVDMSKEAR